MIHYALRCGSGHEFDGWFKSSAAFEAQSVQALVECPVCAARDVTRALMAPRLSRGLSDPPAAVAAVPVSQEIGVPEQTQSEQTQEVIAPPVRMPDAMRVMLQRLRSEVERNCDNVGSEFAAEARRIHAGESEARAIYGHTTETEAESLIEDGIPYQSIPWVPRADG